MALAVPCGMCSRVALVQTFPPFSTAGATTSAPIYEPILTTTSAASVLPLPLPSPQHFPISVSPVSSSSHRSDPTSHTRPCTALYLSTSHRSPKMRNDTSAGEVMQKFSRPSAQHSGRERSFGCWCPRVCSGRINSQWCVTILSFYHSISERSQAAGSSTHPLEY